MTVIGLTVTFTLTSTFRILKLLRQRRASHVEIAFHSGMLIVAAPVALIVIVEYLL